MSLRASSCATGVIAAILLLAGCASDPSGSGGSGGGGGAASTGSNTTGGQTSTTTGPPPPPAITHCACIISTAQNTEACVDCIQKTQSGACQAIRQACNDDATCHQIIDCLFDVEHCTNSSCIKTCLGDSTNYDALADCLCDACATECNDSATCPQ